MWMKMRWGSILGAALCALGLLGMGCETGMLPQDLEVATHQPLTAALSPEEKAVLVGEPGPFWPLKTARVGMSYQDTLAGAVDGAVGWTLVSGKLPPGLTLEPTTGAVRGTPEQPGVYELVVGAIRGEQTIPVRAWVAIFTQDESEIVAGQDFSKPGPYAVARDMLLYTYSSSFNVAGYHPSLKSHPRAYTVDVLSYFPQDIQRMGRLPAVIFQHATGFNFDEYHDILGRIASYGYIVVSAAEYHSYIGSDPSHPDRDNYFQSSNAVAGMQEGSATQEALIGFLEQRDKGTEDDLDALVGKVDFEKLVMMGHSRGGGSTQASHTRGLNLSLTSPSSGARYGLRGVIYWQAYDLRAIPKKAEPPGVAPVYPILDQENRIPFLEISSEWDSDLVFPATDTIIERATGPATQITIYGANHNQMADNHEDDGQAYIPRGEQHDIAVRWMVTFLKRWCENDLTLEGHLYGGEHMGSSQVGHQSRRNMVSSLVVDDFQDATLKTNSLGMPNLVSNSSATLEQTVIYPMGFGAIAPGLSSLNMKCGRLRFYATNTTAQTTRKPVYRTAYTTDLDPTLPLGTLKRFLFRVGAHVYKQPLAYDQLTFDLMLTDRAGRIATVRLFDRNAPAKAFLPDFKSDERAYDRYVQVEVPLQRFKDATKGAFDPTSLQRITFSFEYPAGFHQSYIWMDDLRFE